MSSLERLQAMQREHMEQDMCNPARADLHTSWFRDDTVDFWLHKRMYEAVAPLASHFQDKTWVSIGDGRYGLDAVRMKRLFNLDVFPTDVTEDMLRRGKEMGLFTAYGVENAERLSFADNSFDVVFCKEALHHCPRPMVALHELLRVSRKCLILIEPNDSLVLERPKRLAIGLAKAAIALLAPGRDGSRPSIWRAPGNSYEPSGNYVYGLSRHEMVKTAQSLNLASLGWKGLNSPYTVGCEFEPAEPRNPVFQKTIRAIRRRDGLVRRLPLLFDYGMAVVAIFKERPDAELRQAMVAQGYQFPALSRNPYL